MWFTLFIFCGRVENTDQKNPSPHTHSHPTPTWCGCVGQCNVHRYTLSIQPLQHPSGRRRPWRAHASSLNFCASWCEPCVNLNAVCSELAEEHSGLRFVQACQELSPRPSLLSRSLPARPTSFAQPRVAERGSMPISSRGAMRPLRDRVSPRRSSFFARSLRSVGQCPQSTRLLVSSDLVAYCDLISPLVA